MQDLQITGVLWNLPSSLLQVYLGGSIPFRPARKMYGYVFSARTDQGQVRRENGLRWMASRRITSASCTICTSEREIESQNSKMTAIERSKPPRKHDIAFVRKMENANKRNAGSRY